MKLIIPLLLLISITSFGQKSTIDDLWKLYNARDFETAIDKAEPLLETDPDNIDLNLITGRSLTDLSHHKKAIPYLESTIKNDKRNSWRKAWALAYLGSCQFMLQKYEDSKESINACLDLKVTKNSTRYANKSSVLFGFDNFYKNWQVVESANFRFHFQNMSDANIQNYVTSREEAFSVINDFFKSTLPKKIDFFVWESRDDALNLLNANLGFANPPYCIVHSHFQQTIGHEMTHVISYFSTQMTHQTGLINEGTAVCFDMTSQNREKLVKNWLTENNQTISIRKIWTDWKSYPAELTYPLSGLFVNELIKNFGNEKFMEFFGNQTYENAKMIFGTRLDEVIIAFENKINK